MKIQRPFGHRLDDDENRWNMSLEEPFEMNWWSHLKCLHLEGFEMRSGFLEPFLRRHTRLSDVKLIHVIRDDAGSEDVLRALQALELRSAEIHIFYEELQYFERLEDIVLEYGKLLSPSEVYLDRRSSVYDIGERVLSYVPL